MSSAVKVRKRFRWWMACMVIAAVASAVYLLAVPQDVWKARLGDYLICNEPPEKADLIVVLGGEFFGNRVIKGAELGLQGYAKRVVISGPINDGAKESDRAIEFLASKGYPRQLFVSYGHYAQSTIEEAYALKPLFEHYEARRILIVTSAYHSKRASVVFRGLVPGYRYRFIGSQDDHLRPDTWWTDPESRKYFMSEWVKILGTLTEISWSGRL